MREGIVAEGEDQKPVGKAEVDKDVSKWIRDFAAIVTVLGALAGIAFTAYQLRMKSDADRETARLNSQAEANKLRLGEDQIAAQNKQHAEDAALDTAKRKLDIQQQKDQADALERKEDHAGLSSLVNKMFSDPTGEADIASLFEYVHNDDASREIIENAVLAKLENPNSRGEVDLGFKIFEAIGPSTIPLIIQANCTARRKYDSAIVDEFGYVYHQPVSAEADGSAADKSFRDQVELQIARESSLKPGYVIAVINRDVFGGVPPDSSDRMSELEPEVKSSRTPMELNAAVIESSNGALGILLHGFSRKDAPQIDLSSAYLRGEIVEGTYPEWLRERVKCNGCFFESDSLYWSDSQLGHSWLIHMKNGTVLVGGLGGLGLGAAGGGYSVLDTFAIREVESP
jgi:hypothetical protein